MTEAVRDILQFWFGELDKQGISPPDKQALWFSASDETDRYCRETFGDLVEQAIAGELDHWQGSGDSLMALVVLLDQMTRNIHRDTPRAFAGDARALQLALGVIDGGQHHDMPAIHRVFLYLPLEHSEDLATQQRCVALFAELDDQYPGGEISGFARYATAHHEVIEQFGRFPHRNNILGRESTARELQYLKTHGGF